MKLYYHKTDGGAEYLMDTFIKWKHNGKSGKEGVMNSKTKYVVRIDGDVEKDAELNVREDDFKDDVENFSVDNLKDELLKIADELMINREFSEADIIEHIKNGERNQ